MKQTIVVSVLALLAIAPMSARADLVTVNIDFQPPNGSTYSGPGMASDPGTFWNALTHLGGTNLKASDGVTVTQIDVSTTYASDYKNSGNALLLDRAIWAGSTAAAITVSDLDPTLTYNIYMYVGYYGQTYTIGAESKNVTGLNWTQNHPWTEGTQYVSFMGVSPVGTTITIGDVPYAGGTPYGLATVVSGIQIQAVPVPAAVLLGMLGLGAAGIKLRKHG